MNEAELTAVFEEWKTRYDANPETYMTCAEHEAEPPKSYGQGAARYFLLLVNEMTTEVK